MESKESRLLDPSNWMPVLLRQVSCPHYYWSETQIYSVSTYMRSHQSNSTHTFLRTESKLVITALRARRIEKLESIWPHSNDLSVVSEITVASYLYYIG